MFAKRWLFFFSIGLFGFSGYTDCCEASYINYHYGDHGAKISLVQSQLLAQGYYHGKVDGYFSYALVKSIKAFQQKHGLKQNGELNEKTYETILKQKSVKPRLAAESILKTAQSFIGTPYQYGGIGPKSFDCSGYVEYVFSYHGKQLPRTVDKQYLAGQLVHSLRPADLVFFNTDRKGPSHSGIYLGNGQFIHASSSHGVIISRLNETYWQSRYLGARRVL